MHTNEPPKPIVTSEEFSHLFYHLLHWHNKNCPLPAILILRLSLDIATPPKDYNITFKLFDFSHPNPIYHTPIVLSDDVMLRFLYVIVDLDKPPFDTLRSLWTYLTPYLFNNRFIHIAELPSGSLNEPDITLQQPPELARSEPGKIVLCPKCGIGPALARHTCPYKCDVCNDDKTSCECCETCRNECAADV